MTARTIKWVIFGVLFLTAPAPLYLVQVVMFVPTVVYAIGMLVFVVLGFIPGSAVQPVIVVFIGVHVLLHVGLYYLFATLAAKAIAWIPGIPVRNVVVGIFCAGLAAIALLPVYGGGGHGPVRWKTLPEALADVSKGHGFWAAAVVYGAAALVVGIVLLVRRWRARRGTV